MLCTAMVLIVMSVMGGWLEQVRSKARGMLGDIIVDNHLNDGFPLYQEFIDEISGWPEVVRATPVLYTYGLINFPQTGESRYVRVVGIRLNEIMEVNRFRDGLYYEHFYPGTTTLGEARQPMMGFDPDGPMLKLSTGLEVFPLCLPEPFQGLLEKQRAEHQARSGRPLDDPDTTDGSLNALLRENKQPIIPGEFALSDERLDDGRIPAGYAGDPFPGLILGRDLVAERESDGRYRRFDVYPRGAQVFLTLVPYSSGGTLTNPVKVAFRYVDDQRTGIYDIDSLHVYCDFGLLQQLTRLDEADRIDPQTDEVIGRKPARCMQIQIRVRDGTDARALCGRLNEEYHALLGDERYTLSDSERYFVSKVRAESWEESQAHIIAPVEKERILVTILFGIISLVAVALLLCILYMIVLQKTRDIGILKAIGGSSGGVAFIFVIYGAAVGIVGSLLGALLGTVFVWNINNIQEFLISINPAWRMWDFKVYSFDSIPTEVASSDVVVVVLFAIVSATLGSFAAAWRAGSMQPVEAIRYE